MKKVKLLLLLFLPFALYAQSFEQFITSLNATAASGRQTSVDSFLAVNTSYPLVQNNTKAHFILTSSASLVNLAGDMNGWSSSKDKMTNVASTNLWYITALYEANARLEYKFVLNGSDWILDPRNPNNSAGGFGENSELAMPGYIKPWEIEKRTNTAKGTTKNYTLPSTNTGSTYTVVVYLPANYSTTKTYATAYFQDGTEYLDYANAVNIFDNLIDSGLIEPMIAVFVKPNNRNEEYAFTLKDKYTDFFVKELVPWVDNQWATAKDSSRRAVIGASYGGNISMYIALKHPEIFYKVGQHSGAWQPESYRVLNMFQAQAKPDLAVASVWGTYEGLGTLWKGVENDCKNEGFTKTYFKEHPQGHAWGFWKATLDDILIHLFSAKTTGYICWEYNYGPHYTVYPNPSANFVQLAGNNTTSITRIELTDPLGRVTELPLNASNQVDVKDYASGMYMLTIYTAQSTETHRLVIGR